MDISWSGRCCHPLRVAKLRRPKKSPMIAQARGLALSEMASKSTNRATCHRCPLWSINATIANAPLTMAIELSFRLDQLSPIQPTKGFKTIVPKDNAATKGMVMA